MPDHDDENLLIKRYFEICNTALRLNKNRFPYKQILGAAAAKGAGEKVEMRLSGDAGAPVYVVFIQNDSIIAKPHGVCGDCNCVRTWNVDTGYLQSVIAQPDLYIKNPAKIDWAWMYDGAA